MFAGSLIAGIEMDRYGRKMTLATPLIPIIFAWILTATTSSRAVLFAARVLLGIFSGFGPPVCQVSRNKFEISTHVKRNR